MLYREFSERFDYSVPVVLNDIKTGETFRISRYCGMDWKQNVQFTEFWQDKEVKEIYWSEKENGLVVTVQKVITVGEFATQFLVGGQTVRIKVAGTDRVLEDLVTVSELLTSHDNRYYYDQILSSPVAHVRGGVKITKDKEFVNLQEIEVYWDSWNDDDDEDDF